MEPVNRRLKIVKISAVGLFATLLLLTGSASGRKKSIALPQPSPGNALVIIYREGGMYGEGVSPIIFFNDYLVGAMDLATYAPVEVSQGSGVITATHAEWKLQLIVPSASGSWAWLPGCRGLDWWRLAAAPPADVTLCQEGLARLVGECAPSATWKSVGTYRVRETNVPACNSNLNGSGSAPYLLALAPELRNALGSGIIPPNPGGSLHLHTQLRIEAEAGKTYYVKWSVTVSGGKMKLMEAATGEKEIRKLKVGLVVKVNKVLVPGL